MQSALDAALARAEEAQAKRILSLHLRVGVLTGVVPDALRFAFETLREGTRAAEARLEIESVPAHGWCPGCSQAFEAAEIVIDCPACGRPGPELRGGLELELARIEIE